MDICAVNHDGSVPSSDGILVPRVTRLIIDGLEEGQLVYLKEDWNDLIKGFYYWNTTTSAWNPIVASSVSTNSWKLL